MKPSIFYLSRLSVIFYLFTKIISDLYLVEDYPQSPPPAWQCLALLLRQEDSGGGPLAGGVPGQLARHAQQADLHHRVRADTAQVLHWTPLGEQGEHSFTLLTSSPQTALVPLT